jgi:hypothetical protein
MEFGAIHQSLRNINDQLDKLNPNMEPIERLQHSLVFLYAASRDEPNSPWNANDDRKLKQIAAELESNPAFREQLKALTESESKDKAAEAQAQNNASGDKPQGVSPTQAPSSVGRSQSQPMLPSQVQTGKPPKPTEPAEPATPGTTRRKSGM